jgi:hypothetical protein
MKNSKRFPWYLPFIAAVTGAYLMIEVPFSAHLLDVLAMNPSAADIDAVEKFGRVLTGIAVAIAFVGWFLSRSYKVNRSVAGQVVGAILISIFSVGLTYLTLDRIAVATGDFSTATDRKDAFRSVMAKQVMMNAVEHDMTSSDWKAFVAMASFIGDGNNMLEIAGNGAANASKSEAARRLGTVSDLKDRFFGKDFNSVRTAYLDYKSGVEKYTKARRDADQQIAEGWNKYLVMRKRGGYERIDTPTELYHLRRRVISSGIPVTMSWHPNDRATFDAAHRSKLIGPIEDAYERGFEPYFGKGVVMKPGLDFAGFLAHPALQARLRKDASLPSAGAIIRPAMSDAEFMSAVYVPTREKLTAELERTGAAAVATFADGGTNAEAGKSAVRMATLPMLAIFLSLAGALLHVCKLSGFMTQIFGRISGIDFLSGWKAKYAVGIPVAALFLAAMYIPGNVVTSSKTFDRLTASSSAAMNVAMDVVIGIQPRFQPIGHAMGGVGPWIAIGDFLPASSGSGQPKVRTATASYSRS